MNAGEIARMVEGTLRGDAALELNGVASLEAAGASDLSFAADPKALALAARSQAGCILVPEGRALEGRTTVAVAAPKLAFVRVAALLAPAEPATPGIHPAAVVDPHATLGSGVSAGPGAVIEAGARVGDRTSIGAGAFVGRGATIGADCVIHPRVVIYAGARIGGRVILHAGAVIGGDGFGYVFGDGRQWKFPQVGGVVLEDDVEIGCNATVDRGSLGTTVVGEGTKIDNLVQIAHNVKIGRHCVIAAQTGISGSVEVGDFAVIGGQVGIGDHVTIESGAQIGSKAGILPGKIVRRGSVVWGIPARPLDVFKRQYAHLGRLPDLARRTAEVERKLSGIQERGGSTPRRRPRTRG